MLTALWYSIFLLGYDMVRCEWETFSLLCMSFFDSCVADKIRLCVYMSKVEDKRIIVSNKAYDNK